MDFGLKLKAKTKKKGYIHLKSTRFDSGWPIHPKPYQMVESTFESGLTTIGFLTQIGQKL